jgi:ABC-type transport system substrate-binding protein
MDIIQNATWSDGTKLTADDVANTFTYILESARYGNKRSVELGDLQAAYAPTPTRVVLEFNTESYWHFSRFAYEKIVPKHIFNEDDGISFEDWRIWNPVFNPSEPHITSGPFILTDHVVGEFYELSANPDFCYYPDFSDPPTPSPTPTSQGPDLMLILSAGTVGAGSVILGGGFIMFRKEQARLL